MLTGASVGADDDCGAAEVLQSEKFWADVGGSPPDPTCIVGGDGADREELAGGGMKMMGATTAGAAVPVTGTGLRPEATLGPGSRRVFGPRYSSWVCESLFGSRGMAESAGRRRDRSGEAEVALLGVGRSGSVAQVGTPGPGKLQEILPSPKLISKTTALGGGGNSKACMH